MPSWCIWSMASIISIHAPRGERQKLQYISTRTIAIFQSTLPRGERLETQKTSGSQSEISIHAPARGATYSPHEIKERLQINFNPRSARGATPFGRIFRLFAAISIHAPARGATDDLLAFLGQDQDFNPRSARGATELRRSEGAVKRNFNPRSARGATMHDKRRGWK